MEREQKREGIYTQNYNMYQREAWSLAETAMLLLGRFSRLRMVNLLTPMILVFEKEGEGMMNRDGTGKRRKMYTKLQYAWKRDLVHG